MDEPKRARGSIDRLLGGRDRLTGDEKRAIFARVVTHPDVRTPAKARNGLWLAAAGAAAGALLFVVLPRPHDELTVRGGSPRASFALACVDGGAPSSCRAGATLVFSLEPTPEQRYFAAFARAADGRVVWYFPESEEQAAPAILPQSVLGRGVAIGDEHVPGHYVVTGVFSTRPLSRADVRRLIDEPKPGDEPDVVVRRLDVVRGER